MDFSSSERALKSLERRTPPLSPKVVSLANQLQTIHDNPLDANFVPCIIDLLQIGSCGEPELEKNQEQGKEVGGAENEINSEKAQKDNLRWEPLAVGLHLTDSFLHSTSSYYRQAMRKEENQNDAERKSEGNINNTEEDIQNTTVYMDGPRVPTIAPQAQSNADNSRVTKSSSSNAIINIDEEQLTSFSNMIMQMCQTHLEHNEPRVRSLVAKVVGQHTKLGTTLLNLSHPLGRIIIDRSIELYGITNKSLQEHLASGRDTVNKSKSSEGALDDTTGWRALETNLFGIGSFVHASGHLYFDLVARKYNDNDITTTNEFVVDETLLNDLEYCCIVHVNRHVRAAGIALLEQMVHACASSFRNVQQQNQIQDSQEEEELSEQKNAMDLLLSPDAKLRKCIIKVLKVTLADNWSQVRMAASVLCRVFFVALLDYADQNPDMIQNADMWLTSTYPILLPRMCLNRFYLAQGVKLYSHDTWRIIFLRTEKFGCSGGVESVAMNAAPICRYYVQMCDADNHVVREAGCQAVAELATKLGRSVKYAHYLAPYVVLLLQALLMCFHDESWPVRDEACLACGTFCLAYPEECKPELPILFSRWAEQLTDQIWSLREDAAVALGDAIEAYGAPMFDQVMDVLKENLPGARDEPAMSRDEYKLRQNDIERHTNSQLYSCGSLAPKLRKVGAGRIGCSDCLITRPKAPWEATDGCIYLIRELCIRFCTNGPGTIQEGLALTDSILIPIMTDLADFCRVKHFPQSDDLRTTLWKQLPFMAKALGKQRFKRHYLQLFMDLLIQNMENRSNASSKLSVHAAGQCAEEMSQLVGLGIFRGRFEEDWQKDVFDRTMQERKIAAINSGPGPQAFSPFGPLGGLVPATFTSNESKDEFHHAPPIGERREINCPPPPVVTKHNVPGNAQFETL